ncbi:hypothetical protein KAW80_02145 [Candidatus Babeliales bacterium]|nr:hypothetical protein [Candidatus Babeliales bacterium]
MNKLFLLFCMLFWGIIQSSPPAHSSVELETEGSEEYSSGEETDSEEIILPKLKPLQLKLPRSFGGAAVTPKKPIIDIELMQLIDEERRAEEFCGKMKSQGFALDRAKKKIEEQHNEIGFARALRGTPDDLLYLSFIKSFELFQKKLDLLLEYLDKIAPELSELFLDVLAHKRSESVFHFNPLLQSGFFIPSVAIRKPRRIFTKETDKIFFFINVLRFVRENEGIHSKVLKWLTEMNLRIVRESEAENLSLSSELEEEIREKESLRDRISSLEAQQRQTSVAYEDERSFFYDRPFYDRSPLHFI